MKVPAGALREACRGVEAKEQEYQHLQRQADDAARRLAEARRAKAELELHDREERSRLIALASDVLDGGDCVVSAEDSAAIARLVPELRSARAARTREMRAALSQVYVPLEQYEQLDGPARRRGFADADEV